MPAVRFKIVFHGELMPEASLENTKNNLARLFKSDPGKIESLFSGASIAIKRNLTEDEADKYIAALQKAGARVRKEQDLAASLSLVETEDHRAPESVDDSQVACPKCGHMEAKTATCSACGIVIEKYLARQAQQQENPSTAAPTPSPYATPKAQISDSLEEYSDLKVFSVSGRIGRARFLAWSLVLLLATYGAMLVAAFSLGLSAFVGAPLALVVMVATVVVSVQIGVQRLHDIGWSGWLYLLHLVPVVNFVFALLMLVIPGTTGSNRFGPPPPPNSTAVKILAWLWLVVPVAMAGIITAVAIPAYQQYLSRAAGG